MFALFAPLVRAFAPTTPTTTPRQLMERADASAGHDPHEAAALREAAQVWLRVVR